MGGGGFISDMNSSMKESRRVRNKKPSIYDSGKEGPPTTEGEPLRFKKMTPEERSKFKEQLAESVRKRKRMSLIAYIVGAVLTSIVIWSILHSLTS